jgi:hypothetical protein
LPTWSGKQAPAAWRRARLSAVGAALGLASDDLASGIERRLDALAVEMRSRP